MRVLLLLRGSPGCGKTTWIEQNGLKNYAISADDIRMLCSSSSLTVSGKEEISQDNDQVVWSTLLKILELRMQNGEFTVIDATCSKTSELNRYKELCAPYKYRIYCVDFTDIPIEVAKERNLMRPEVKQVPESAIDKMYARFQTQKIPSGITVIKPDELDKIWLKQFDLSEYKKVHHIGDIHGCYSALKEYLDSEGGFKDDEFYIFCGDYIDRGLENAEVVNFLLSIYEKPNVCILEGNHEKWLHIWASGGVCKSKEFEFFTRAQLENAGISKKEVRKLYRRFGQCAYYKYGKNTYIATHGGLSTLPQNLTLVSTNQMIRGVGNYNDFEEVANSFVRNTPDNCYQFHGHRNTKQLPVSVNERVFNLEGAVDFGGHLRVVQALPDDTHIIREIKNNLFKEPVEQVQNAQNTNKNTETVGDMILSLRENRYVQEKRFGNISSFNFTKQAFYDRVWDEQTTKARGLYINIPKQKIVARAYDKFFNINERPETKLDMLQYKLAFPAVAYVKENGFLGIMSYNEEDDSLFVTTKSTPDGEFSGWLKEILHEKLSEQTLEAMKEYSKEHNVSFVFECVDMKNDPHIIEYNSNNLFLLDVIYNDMSYRKYSFEDLCLIANNFGLPHKEKAFVLENWSEFFDWYYRVIDEDYMYDNKRIEGFVIEDSNGYMVKLKLNYYNFWKFMRSIAHETLRNGYINGRKTAQLTSAKANQFYGWLKTLYEAGNTENIPRDICSLRKLFFQSDIGKSFADE